MISTAVLLKIIPVNREGIKPNPRNHTTEKHRANENITPNAPTITALYLAFNNSLYSLVSPAYSIITKSPMSARASISFPG